MDNYREKIIRIVERELKRTEEYQQRRDEYGNEEYILGCIMVKGDAFPKEVIAHAFVEDMGLELQFQIWRDEPRVRQMYVFLSAKNQSKILVVFERKKLSLLKRTSQEFSGVIFKVSFCISQESQYMMELRVVRIFAPAS